ncbi:MAG: glycosyltransferase family 4 protein [Mesorhizobium sp.]|uniref:glycosyltransferase n=2 Tax=Mesorhizobium sp. TaxID=1871066 RepID=UPI000FE958B0|nr:glycosyltransferase [Mesorhizobium sp.]RWM03848.1 MAG: glycosyltransferase [Mesorhizobium sp.]TIO48773.1 MAG: glycosyltransferase family 4 protein [Mesorhizobium sp.]TIO58174.1 MAG: glycosyltransferase family 4 protein [Mesorhizobium sp.]TJV58976.1 MAG: glycosyltransferase family 4 protein [Mesorhizobium sp.]
MRITLVLMGAIPGRGYAGIERQVEWLATELVRLGHKVVIIGAPGSSHPLCEVRHASTDAEAIAAIPDDTQIVHTHSWPLDLGRPVLNTMREILTSLPNVPNWSFISANHARFYGHKTFVYNGFPVDKYRLSAAKNRNLLFLAGIARSNKGLSRAVDLARKFDFNLDIAGGSRWKLLGRSQARRDRVFLRTLGSRYRFHGLVDGELKLRLLGEARAFLNPIAWEEPFGNAPVEAMLCGTPVLTTPRGALPETVDADSGRFFQTDEEFAAALEEVGSLTPQQCRESAATRFPIRKTAMGYLDLYARILDGEALS